MLDDLKDLFREGLEYSHTAGILQQLANLTNILSTQYMKEGSARNDAIDIVCGMLQKHKDVAPVDQAISLDAPNEVTPCP